jgi:hypothetical protein
VPGQDDRACAAKAIASTNRVSLGDHAIGLGGRLARFRPPKVGLFLLYVGAGSGFEPPEA